MAFDIKTIGAALALRSGSSNADTNAYAEASKITPIVSGSPVYIDDASGNGVEGITTYGESTQLQTTGKNKLNLNGITEKTANGITFTPVFENGLLKHINVTGTATADTYYAIIEQTNVPQESLILNGCNSGSPNTYSLLITYRDENGAYADQAFQYQSTTDLLIDTTQKIYSVTIFVKSGATASNVKFYPMIRNASITDATYEPYTNGVASPSPDYPQPIKTKIVNRFDVLGKNLLKFSQGSTTINGITFTVNADKSVTVNGTATADAVLLLTTSTRGEVNLKRLTGKNIILSGCPNGGSVSTYRFQFWSDSKMAVDTGNGATLDLSTVPDTWNFAISIISGTTVNNLTYKPMIRLASITDATYEPYQSQTVNLSAPIELNGIGGVRDMDKLKKFGVVVFDGSDDEGWSKSNTLDGRYILPMSDAKEYAELLCTHAPRNIVNDSLINTCAINTVKYFYINTSFSTLADWKAHLASNPMKLVYELAEPIETELPQADIDAIKSLHTYKPNTVVMNDADALMDVHYIADTKAYIDKKISALTTAILDE